MSTNTLEQRVAALERDVAVLKHSRADEVGKPSLSREWDKTFGAFANDSGFEEMVRLGKEIREQDREDDSNGPLDNSSLDR